MTVRASWNGKTLAESDRTILVEGNQYFPPQDLVPGVLEASDTHSHCPWKGDASYHHVVVDGKRNPDAAWYYPEPFEAAEPVRDYVAFWHGVDVEGANEGQPEVRPPGR
ncbi:MAG: hypothetical protein JWM85_801 [Acidimicrobiaceae bacterium]|nr:hypothetical protein [Acidimicrobiaceae bacterium]